jgi:signal transduction histidine kinase
VGRTVWPLCPPPDGRGLLWRVTLGSLAALPGARARLRAGLGRQEETERADGGPAEAPAAGTDEDAAEQLVLAFDELASNALRHGRPPVVASVVSGRGGWLLDVSDTAPEDMPTPAVDRDPSYGGMGLHMVARLALAHGWYVDADRKHVWACLPSRHAPA